MFKEVIYLLVLILAVPVGLILRKLCKEEIKSWRYRLILISFVSIILSLLLVFVDYKYKTPTVIGLFFIALTNLTVIYKC